MYSNLPRHVGTQSDPYVLRTQLWSQTAHSTTIPPSMRAQFNALKKREAKCTFERRKGEKAPKLSETDANPACESDTHGVLESTALGIYTTLIGDWHDLKVYCHSKSVSAKTGFSNRFWARAKNAEVLKSFEPERCKLGHLVMALELN